MATISKSLIYGTTANTDWSAKLLDASSLLYGLAPIIYVDSASPLASMLTTWPASTAVTVGTAFRLPNTAQGGYVYLECTVAGTTAASSPVVSTTVPVGQQYTSGTSTWRARAYHGWSRACPVMQSNTYITTSGNYRMIQLLASTSNAAINYASSLLPSNGTYTRFALFSVSKAAGDVVTNYAAGSALTYSTSNTGSFEGPYQVVRGVTLTNTFVPTSTTLNYRSWQSRKYIDCTLRTTFDYTGNSYPVAAHGSTYRALRCTFQNLQSAGASTHPVFGSYGSSNDSSADACTYSRATNTNNSVPVLAVSSTSSGNSFNDTIILGADVSGIAASPWGHSFGPSSFYEYTSVDPRLYLYGINGAATQPPSYPFVQGESPAYQLFPRSAYTSIGTTEATRILTSNKTRTYTRVGGANDGIGLYALTMQAGLSMESSPDIWFMNTRVNEGFVINIDYEYSAAVGITGLSEEDVWLEAVYLDTTNTMHGQFVTSIQNRETRPGLFLTGAGPRLNATSTSTWNGALASAVKQRMSVTVSPRRPGPIKLRIRTWLCPWTRSNTGLSYLLLHVCPKPILTAAP